MPNRCGPSSRCAASASSMSATTAPRTAWTGCGPVAGQSGPGAGGQGRPAGRPRAAAGAGRRGQAEPGQTGIERRPAQNRPGWSSATQSCGPPPTASSASAACGRGSMSSPACRWPAWCPEPGLGRGEFQGDPVAAYAAGQKVEVILDAYRISRSRIIDSLAPPPAPSSPCCRRRTPPATSPR